MQWFGFDSFPTNALERIQVASLGRHAMPGSAGDRLSFMHA